MPKKNFCELIKCPLVTQARYYRGELIKENGDFRCRSEGFQRVYDCNYLKRDGTIKNMYSSENSNYYRLEIVIASAFVKSKNGK